MWRSRIWRAMRMRGLNCAQSPRGRSRSRMRAAVRLRRRISGAARRGRRAPRARGASGRLIFTSAFVADVLTTFAISSASSGRLRKASSCGFTVSSVTVSRVLAVGDLDDVVAKLAAHRLADLVFLHARTRLRKTPAPSAPAEEIEVAAVLLGARIFGKFLGQLGKVFALLHARRRWPSRPSPFPTTTSGFASAGTRHQDVAGAHLLGLMELLGVLLVEIFRVLVGDAACLVDLRVDPVLLLQATCGCSPSASRPSGRSLRSAS